MIDAWKAEAGSSTKKLVLLKLADHANSEGVCWPKPETLAAGTECSRATIFRTLDALETAGLIYRVQGHKEVAVYFLNFGENAGRWDDSCLRRELVSRILEDLSRNVKDLSRNVRLRYIKEPPIELPKEPEPQAAVSNGRFTMQDASGLFFELLPDEFKGHEAFALRLREYLEGRAAKKKAATENAVRLLAKKLKDFTPGECAEALATSIESGWTGVFPKGGTPESSTEAMTQPRLATDWGFGDD